MFLRVSVTTAGDQPCAVRELPSQMMHLKRPPGQEGSFVARVYPEPLEQRLRAVESLGNRKRGFLTCSVTAEQPAGTSKTWHESVRGRNSRPHTNAK